MKPKLRVDLSIIYEEANYVIIAHLEGNDEKANQLFTGLEATLDKVYDSAGDLNTEDYQALTYAKQLVDTIGEMLQTYGSEG